MSPNASRRRSPPAHAERRRIVAWVGLFASIALVALPALADGPILHEYVAYDPSSDGELGAVTMEGGFAAEMQTRSGTVTAPDVGRPITPKSPMYGPSTTVPTEVFTPDRDVRRVDHVAYDEPFRPSIAPFKRLGAFDAIDDDYRLRVRDRARKVVDLSSVVSPPEPIDTFYVDLALELRAREAIRIPTPIAGSVVKKAHVVPSVPFHLERDGAENLFVVAEGAGPARLVMEVAAPRDAFGGKWGYGAGGGWGDMNAKLLPILPAKVQKAGESVARDLGISRSTHTPGDAIRSLVGYFREFKEGETPLVGGGDIYLDIARSKKGVCRHRAFAMMITAVALGIPTRFVFNEAHAWVEAHDGSLWRRIDLGGAGRLLDDRTERPERPQPTFEPPPDPYAWPPGATRGSDLVPPAVRAVPPASSGAAGTAPRLPPAPAGPVSPPSGSPSPPPSSKLTLQLPAADGELQQVVRARGLDVAGRATASDGTPCKQVRVEIVLRSAGNAGERIAGVLVTDDAGAYAGSVMIPSDLALGDYAVVAHTPGGSRECGQGTSD